MSKESEMSDIYPVPENCSPPSHLKSRLDMPYRQQLFFLNLFWQTYHSMIPILCEIDFRAHFDSLWDGNSRRSSPLVDVILALCIQYGRKFIVRGGGDSEDDASRWYFHQCRKALAENWEAPSMSTIQAYIFMIIYLQNIARPTCASILLASAVQAAYRLGLHLKRHRSNETPYVSELATRTWWTLFILDTKLSVELGSPRLIDISTVCCPPPRDDPDLARHTITNFASNIEGISWLSHHAQEVKLLEAVRMAHTRFFNGELSTSEIYKDSQELERTAELLTECMEPIRTWAAEVPAGLRTPRQAPDSTFSTQVSPACTAGNTPLWIQLQRIVLECEYHKQCLYLYRTFIHFHPHAQTATPLADAHATSALQHATALTSILREIILQKFSFASCYYSVEFIWQAAIVMLAYTLAYPVSPPTPEAREGIMLAIEVLEILGKDIGLGKRAGKVLKDLNDKAMELMNNFQQTLNGFESTERTETSQVEIVATDAEVNIVDLNWPSGNDYNADMWNDFLDGLGDSAGIFLDRAEMELEPGEFEEPMQLQH